MEYDAEQVQFFPSPAHGGLSPVQANDPVLNRVITQLPQAVALSILSCMILHNIFCRLSVQSSEQLHSPEIQVGILATAVVTLQFLQFIFCHERSRRGNHWLVQGFAWVGYYAPVPLAASAVGVMLRFRCPYRLVAVFFAAGQSDTMSAYSLHDDKQNVRRFAKRTLSLAYLIVALLQGGGLHQSPAKLSSLVVGLLVFIMDLIIHSWAMIPSSDICMAAAEHVRSRARPQDSQAGRQDHVVAMGSLGSYRSAVEGCTSYQDIRRLNCSPEMDDVCLSSALFLQLLQKYEKPQLDYYCSSNNNLLFKHWLSSNNHPTARVFRIVEVQLSFMHDYFFTAHGSPSRVSYRLYMPSSFLKMLFLYSVSCLVYSVDEGTAGPELRTSFNTIYALYLLELCQLVHYLASNWLIVSFMCERARNTRHLALSLLPILSTMFRKAGSQEGISWQNRLGQYSFVEEFDRTSLRQWLMGRRPGISRTPVVVALSDDIKGWVFDRAISPDPSGWTSFPPHELSGTTEIQTILKWHIATWFCAKTEETRRNGKEVARSLKYRVSTKLSRYCGYLVAFHPELLPGHQTVTSSILDELVEEAEFRFRGQTSQSERYARMETWKVEHSSDQGTTLELGVKLGRRLRNEFDCWKIMADFWTEMLLLVAQSDNAAAHIEHLARGGEFVTHVWAFLYNAGKHKSRTFIKWNKDEGGESSQAFLQGEDQGLPTK